MNIEELEKLLADVTPGEWRVSPDGYRVTDKHVWFDQDGARHGETPNIVIFAETKDNARLIALAPALARRIIAAEKLADALRAFDPQVIGSGPSTNMRMLIDAQQAARAALDEWEKGGDVVKGETMMTEEQYLAAIDAEAIRRGYMAPGDSLVSATGEECWLEAWRDDPTLTPEEQVAEEIACAAQSL